MRVGFFINQLDNRGTGNALYDYARYNEEYLLNESVIYTKRNGAHSLTAVLAFDRRFDCFVDPDPEMSDVDVMYHIKSGEDDGTRFPNVRYAVHAVFNTGQPHGDRFATISEWLGGAGNVPYVPHIIDLPRYHRKNLRQSLGIAPVGVVYGRYGAYDTFDIPWVREAVLEAADEHPDLTFLFANTDDSWVDRPRRNIIFLPELTTQIQKVEFINTCDAMLHARMRGETFGIAVGEFSFLGKRILTYDRSPEQAHLGNLGSGASPLAYSDKRDLLHYFEELSQQALGPRFGYQQFSPDRVMDKFNEVFLS